MYFIPLSQAESVDLVVHALRIAAGEADCSTCPARKVCMRQCLTIADAVARMVAAGTLPTIEDAGSQEAGSGAVFPDREDAVEKPGDRPRPGLKLVQ